MNSKKRTLVSLFAKRLSNHSDENFKLVQFLSTYNNELLFELREMFKGCRTDTGFILMMPEFHWFEGVLISNDSSVHKLEHNNRTITVDKSNKETLITVTKSNGKTKKMLLKSNEITNMLAFLTEIYPKIRQRFKFQKETFGELLSSKTYRQTNASHLENLLLRRLKMHSYHVHVQ